MPNLSKQPVWATFGLVVIVVAISVITLVPSPPPNTDLPGLCIICGTRGSADFLLNVGLFAPVGALLVLAHIRPTRSVALCFILSGAIELTQLIIPGRNSNLGDLLANTAGGAIGVLIVMRVMREASARSLFHRLNGFAAWGLTSSVIAATAFLLTPRYPETTYFGQWTPDLEHLDRYRGRIIGAQIGTDDVPEGRLRGSQKMRVALQEAQPVRVDVLGGPLPDKLAPIFSIYDEHQQEILLIGADRGDLVARRRLHADHLRFDRPDLRAHELMAVTTPGDTIRIQLDARGDEPCLALNGDVRCDVAHTPGLGWTLLMYPEHLPHWAQAMLSALWLVAITLPIGLLSTSRPEWILATTGTGAVLVVVAIGTSLVFPTPVEWIGLVVGTTSGRFLRPSGWRSMERSPK